MIYASFSEEKKLWKRGYKFVACLDEAGRGPLAGPVVAGAVVLARLPMSGKLPDIGSRAKLKDSKQLSPKQREKFYKLITNDKNIKWGIGIVSEKIIDKINILEAAKLAMVKATKDLNKRITRNGRVRHFSRDRGKSDEVDFLILDGKMVLDLPIPQKSIVKADEKVFSCAAASIIAKVTRDKIMARYHKKYPQYGFDKHKGYPTELHKKMLREYGLCSIHRKSFGPVMESQKPKTKKPKLQLKIQNY